ncbi:c-type cytochrome biogenesis protein CcmI [Aliamphritea spongicola]|uniref:c-type cytochrome biogenesis protein CcmI n=1 Tax=Aliamphritea spongicola TaxID=707589 RepID=UPI00196A8C25|nr:c-type cytochrome biogenesis protein CcmI [Aliamphritea spongicola]MBN3563552.1 c-type cytochrome biogenesis protein CcmI [Aliamphritea spongicola]
MTSFWLGIAALSALAMCFVLLPYFRARRMLSQPQNDAVDRQAQNVEIYKERVAELDAERDAGNLSDDDHAGLKLELEKNLLNDVADLEALNGKPLKLSAQTLVTVVLLAVLIPVSAIAIYGEYGRIDDVRAVMNGEVDPFNGQTPSMDEAIAELEARLQNEPDKPEGWFLLANSYMNMQRYEDASRSFEKVLELLPEDAPQYAGVQGQYAQALYLANNNRLNEDIRALLDDILVREPYEVTALGLLGIDAYENGQFREALGFWRRAYDNAEPVQQESLRSGIESARQALIEQGESVPELPELKNASLSINVSIKPEIAQTVSPDSPVFIFARPVGGRVPLAAVRLTVADLPANVILDDSLAMQPQMTLSSVDEVEIIARVSSSGELRPQAGDLTGTISPVAVQQQVDILDLSIDQIVE